MSLETDSTSAEEQPTVESEIVEQPQQEISIDSIVDGMFDDEGEPKEKVEEVAKSETEPEQMVEPEPEPTQQKITIAGQELTLEEVEQGYLRQQDYTKKTQELSEAKKVVQPFEVLNSHLANNPEVLKQVVELIKSGGKPQQEPQASDDPIEALKQEVLQEANEKTTDQVAAINQQMLVMQKQQQINNVISSVRQDALYEQTHGAIVDYIQKDYAAIHGVEEAKVLYQRLDTNPEEYLKLYKAFRGNVKQDKPLKRKETSAPVLASSESAVPNQQGMQKKVKAAEVKKLHDKARGGGVDDVVNYLSASGLFDHLS